MGRDQQHRAESVSAGSNMDELAESRTPPLHLLPLPHAWLSSSVRRVVAKNGDACRPVEPAAALLLAILTAFATPPPGVRRLFIDCILREKEKGLPHTHTLSGCEKKEKKKKVFTRVDFK